MGIAKTSIFYFLLEVFIITPMSFTEDTVQSIATLVPVSVHNRYSSCWDIERTGGIAGKISKSAFYPVKLAANSNF